ncbi:cytochrome P450 [Clohesyomyces aquaticus]|uniref:Cytochrome P450 n=1 Tax=Clohesyomyces aquaticus TaxID=1231657 RepID=A0A1Y2A895_9PLEO|nr:cytochrome P450 [Clohesyomyces aquaticus]
MAIITPLRLVISLVALFVARRAYWEATTGSRRRALQRDKGCLPPKRFRTTDPIFGLDLFFRFFRHVKEHTLLSWFERALSDNNTNTISVNVSGSPMFITIDTENVKSVLTSNFESWSIGSERISFMSSFLGTGIFTTEGPAWRHSRDLLRPCFERSQVSDVLVMEKYVKHFISKIPGDGTTIDLEPLIHRLTMDVALEFLFGRSTGESDNATTDKDREKFITAFNYCQDPHNAKPVEKWGILGFWLPDPTFKKSVKCLQEFVDKIIEDEIALGDSKPKPSKERYVFLHEILSQTSDRQRIRSELLNILIAGQETTASLLNNIFFELPRQPRILENLREEIRNHVGNEPPSWQQLKDMKYLRAVINESQRLYPIVPGISREALHDTVLPRGGGLDQSSPVFVPKGAFVQCFCYSMHRIPSIYGEDAEIFNPDRWLDNKSSTPLRPGWAYLPFNGGPRICIGQQFALTEAGYVIVRLLQHFEVFESRDNEPWREKLALTCTSFGGSKVGLKVHK